ncbi:hypothetical protein AB0D67_18485 [Streptosporangium sp. NPDC048047]|uniref:hypothetical protein n=1 Tax=Streptosporangium sp. NPDC048047 TaxID=3155748 RepID=UPI00344A467C
MTSNKIRFEIHDSDTPVPGAEIDPEAHRVISGLADRYGSQATRAGHMAWAELHNRRAVTT